jgi:hypothetical protein
MWGCSCNILLLILMLPIDPELNNETMLSTDYFNGLKKGVPGTPSFVYRNYY